MSSCRQSFEALRQSNKKSAFSLLAHAKSQSFARDECHVRCSPVGRGVQLCLCLPVSEERHRLRGTEGSGCAAGRLAITNYWTAFVPTMAEGRPAPERRKEASEVSIAHCQLVDA